MPKLSVKILFFGMLFTASGVEAKTGGWRFASSRGTINHLV
jgi:hypothetical protein